MQIVVNLRYRKTAPKIKDVLDILKRKGTNKSAYIDRIARYYSKDQVEKVD